ncbi:unnamed protein product [Linum tenue]|uniref:Uncharacterized protein n=1 Tax=Linum tenue TaxID=586396 RepID=A0AAV0GWR1_9ROSI|nr:unnamed protein product [Linum tenue]
MIVITLLWKNKIRSTLDRVNMIDHLPEQILFHILPFSTPSPLSEPASCAKDGRPCGKPPLLSISLAAMSRVAEYT